MLTLDETIQHCEEKVNCTECGKEHKQLANWLKMLQKYLNRDTPMQITEGSLSGRYVCPSCGELMVLGVRNFCDNCGQAIKQL